MIITYLNVPRVINKPNEILVKSMFVGVNFIDTYHRSGLYSVQLPYIPGREASGVVEAVGSEVSFFSPRFLVLRSEIALPSWVQTVVPNIALLIQVY